ISTIMAKKPADNPEEAKDKPAAPAEQPAGAEAKKPRAPKTKAPKGEPAPSAAAEAAAPVAPSTAAPAPAAAAPTGSTKKKGRQPGHPPRRGKKLLNKVKNDHQRIAKAGAAPLKQALALLKQIKRAKFDETVEVHMSLGIDTTQSDQMIRG